MPARSTAATQQAWEGMSTLSRWWLAARKGVGPSPPLAPGALAQAGFCVLLATVRHPSLRRDRATAPQIEDAPLP